MCVRKCVIMCVIMCVCLLKDYSRIIVGCVLPDVRLIIIYVTQYQVFGIMSIEPGSDNYVTDTPLDYTPDYALNLLEILGHFH